MKIIGSYTNWEHNHVFIMQDGSHGIRRRSASLGLDKKTLASLDWREAKRCQTGSNRPGLWPNSIFR